MNSIAHSTEHDVEGLGPLRRLQQLFLLSRIKMLYPKAVIYRIFLLLLLCGRHAFALEFSDNSRPWILGLEFLLRENMRDQYLEVQSDVLKSQSLTSDTYLWLLDKELDRKDRDNLNKLALSIHESLCQGPVKSRPCRDFRQLWEESLSLILFHESSAPKLHRSRLLSQEKNCREALSVLKEVERAEGRCVPVLETWIEWATCSNDTGSQDTYRQALRQMRGLENAN